MGAALGITGPCAPEYQASRRCSGGEREIFQEKLQRNESEVNLISFFFCFLITTLTPPTNRQTQQDPVMQTLIQILNTAFPSGLLGNVQ